MIYETIEKILDTVDNLSVTTTHTIDMYQTDSLPFFDPRDVHVTNATNPTKSIFDNYTFSLTPDNVLTFAPIYPIENTKETEEPMSNPSCAYSIPAVKHIVHNESKGTTTVYWKDETKTTVRLMAGDTYDKYAAFCAACCKKLFGSSTMAKRIRDRHDIEYIKELRAEERRKAEEAKLQRRNRYERRQARKIARQVQQDERISDLVNEILGYPKQ